MPDREKTNPGLLLAGKLTTRTALAAAAFLASLGWYLYCAAPTLYWGDSAEMTSVACSAGVAHSPGYPLFSIAARMFLWLPLATPFAANMASVFFAAAAVAALFLFLAKYTGLRYGPLAGTVMFAAVPAFIFHSLFIEVYSFHVFLFCAAMYFLAANERGRDARFFLAALLCFSLGMAHHILMYFAMAAFLLYCLLRSHEERAAAVPLLLFFAFSFMNLLISHSLAADALAYYKWTLAGVAAVYVLYLALLARFARLRFTSSMATMAAGLFIFAAAAWVFAYLPLTSARQPVADWWSPDTPGNFLNLLFLKGYPPTFPHTMPEFMKRLDITGLMYQMPPAASWIFGLMIGLWTVSRYLLAAAIIAFILILLFKRGQLALMVILCGAATFAGALLVKHGKPEALRIPVYLSAAILSGMFISIVLGLPFWSRKKWRAFLAAPLYLGVIVMLALSFLDLPQTSDAGKAFKNMRFSRRVDWRMMSRSGSAYELGDSIINGTAPGGLLFIGQQSPSIIGYFQACEPERLKRKKIVPIPVSFLSFDWKMDQLRDAYRDVYFPPAIRKPDSENVFGAGGVDQVKYVADMLRQNPDRLHVYSDIYFMSLSAGYVSMPRGVLYRIVPAQILERATGGYECGKLASAMIDRKPPQWKMLDPRDAIAAENVASINNERGRIYFEFGNSFNCDPLVAEAGAEFDRALKHNPNYAEAWSNKGKVEFASFDIKSAVKHQRKAIALKPNDPDIHNELAQTLLQSHTEENAALAVAELMKSLVLNPKQPRVFYSLGNAFTLLGKKEESVKFFKAAIQAAPEYLEAYRALERLLYATGGCAEAISMIETASDRARESADVQTQLDMRCELATRYRTCGFNNLFNQTMRDIFVDFKHDLNFYQAVGVVYRNTGRVEDAVDIYRRAKKEFPDSGFKLSNLFISLTPTECDTTLPLIQKAVELAPDDFSIRLMHGSNLCLCNKPAACESELLEAKRIDPKETGVDKLLGQLYELKKKKPKLFGKQPLTEKDAERLHK